MVWAVELLVIADGLALLAGLLTPLAGAAAAIGYLVLSIREALSSDSGAHSAATAALYLATMSIGLVLLGPGAFSLDALFFGRREIVIGDGLPPE